MKYLRLLLLVNFLSLAGIGNAQVTIDKINKLKAEAIAEVEKQYVLGQQINDMLFSFPSLVFRNGRRRRTSLLF